MSIQNKINYSIIIPHRNTPDLLKTCLSSIPDREDIQIIVVDDKEKKGAGNARNLGLLKATGNWILFADADDYFTENFIQYLDIYQESEYDLIYFGIYRISKESEQNSIHCQKYDKLMNDAINNGNHDQYKYTAYVPWGKMIKHSLISENNIKFDETIAANDRMFSLKTAYISKNTHFDSNRIYTYLPEHGTITKNRSLAANFDRFSVYLRANSFLKSIGQKKYSTNLFIPLIKLFSLKNIRYFLKALNLIFNTQDENP